MAIQLDDNTIGKIISDMESSDYRERREEEYRAFEVFSGALKSHVKNKLQELFPESWRSMRIGNSSLSRKIIDKVSRSYKEAPMRILQNDSNTDLLSQIYKQGKFNRSFKHMDHLFNLHRYCALWVSQNMDGSFGLRALPPYSFAVIRDQIMGEVTAFIVNFPDSRITSSVSDTGDGLEQLIAEDQADTSANTRVYGIWTKTEHVMVKVEVRMMATRSGSQKTFKIERVPILGNPNDINPLGVIPFVFLTKDPSVDLPLLNPLTDQTIDLNVMWSDLLTASALQGFGQLVLKFEEGSRIENISTGLTTAISLPQPSRPDAPPTDATYISPSPDLAGQLNVLQNYARSILSEHGITTAEGINGDQVERFSSGLDRLIAQADVQNKIEENQGFYSDAENQVFKIIKSYFAARNSGVFRNEEELSVIYPKPRVLISDKETLDNIEKRLNLGLIQKFEALRLIDPNLSEDEAKEKLERIDAEKAERVESFFGSQQGNSLQVANDGGNRGLPIRE